MQNKKSNVFHLTLQNYCLFLDTSLAKSVYFTHIGCILRTQGVRKWQKVLYISKKMLGDLFNTRKWFKFGLLLVYFTTQAKNR
jgi:hypothetical protein